MFPQAPPRRRTVVQALSGFLLMLAFVAPVNAAVIPSVGSGDWFNPATWSGGVVPGPADQAIVTAGHAIYIASAGVTTSTAITLDRLTVNGTLITDNTPGFGGFYTIAANRVTVNVTGQILGQNGTPSWGTTLYFFGVNSFNVQNFGAIIAGDGLCGGTLGFFGYDANWNALPTSVFNSSGIVAGGRDGGCVYVYVRDLALTGGVVSGGDDLSGQCCAGSVWLYAEVVLNIVGNALVQSGSSPRLCGGEIWVVSNGTLTLGTNAQLTAGTLGGGAQNCVITWAATQTILGTISGGTCIRMDPPDVIVTDTATFSSKNIVIAGANVAITNLLDPGQIQATETLTVKVNPGGTLDLRNLAAGQDWLSAGSGISLYADTILLDPGVSIGDIMDPAPTVFPGEEFAQVCLNPSGGASYAAQPGTSLQIPYQVMNCGSAASDFTVSLTGPGDWLTNPSTVTQTLQPGQNVRGFILVTVPDAPTGATAQVILDVSAPNGAAANAVITFAVPKGPATDCNGNGIDDAEDIKAGTSKDCFDYSAASGTVGGANGVPDECECVADWNRDGTTNSTDVSDFINTFFADQTPPGATNGDVNCDGTSNSTDVSDFINTWFSAQAGQLPFAGCVL